MIYALLALLGMGLASLVWATRGVKADIGARFVALSFLTVLASFVAVAAFGLPGRAGGNGNADGGLPQGGGLACGNGDGAVWR